MHSGEISKDRDIYFQVGRDDPKPRWRLLHSGPSRLSLCQVREGGVGDVISARGSRASGRVTCTVVEPRNRYQSLFETLHLCTTNQTLPKSTFSNSLGLNDVDVKMMLGHASWQTPLRLASTRPNLGRHILIFSRSISHEPNEQLKGWVRLKGLKKPQSPKPELPSPVFKVSPEIAQAVRKNLPVVALETTIYTHGFPYPENLALALDLEKIVKENGAIPATIGVVNGVAKVGLTSNQIKMLAEGAGKPETMKVSRRDLPYILGMVSRTNFSFRLMLFSEVFKTRAHTTT
jgi:hypothetical protein